MTDPNAPTAIVTKPAPAAAQSYNIQPTLDLLSELPGQLADLKVAKASGMPALIAFGLGLLALVAAAVQGTAPSSNGAFYAGLVLTVVGAIKSVLVTLANHAAQTAATTGAADATAAVATAIGQVHAANAAAVANVQSASLAAGQSPA